MGIGSGLVSACSAKSAVKIRPRGRTRTIDSGRCTDRRIGRKERKERKEGAVEARPVFVFSAFFAAKNLGSRPWRTEPEFLTADDADERR